MSISTARPGLRESTEAFVTVTAVRNGGLSFDGDNQHPAAPERVRRLVALLGWFPLPARHERRTIRPARSERLELEDVARHVWNLGFQEGRPIDKLGNWRLRRFLRGYGLLPGWLRPADFVASPQLLRVILAQSRLMRSLHPPGLDVQAVCARLTKLGLTREIVERNVPFEAEQVDAFPVIVESRSLSPSQRKDLAALSGALLPLKRSISPAEVEQVLLDCRKSEPEWIRGYTA